MEGRCVYGVACCLVLSVSIALGQATQPALPQQVLLKVAILKVSRDAKAGDASGGQALISLADQNTADLITQLEKQGKVEVLSRPFMLVEDAQLTSVSFGPRGLAIDPPKRPATAPAEAIGFNDWSLTVDLRPHLSREGPINMEIASEFKDSRPFATIQPQPASPIITTRAAKTRLSTTDGKTILIHAASDQVANTTTELLVLVTPRIMAPPAGRGN